MKTYDKMDPSLQENESEADYALRLSRPAKDRAERDQEYHNNFRNLQNNPRISRKEKAELKHAYTLTSFAYASWFAKLSPIVRSKITSKTFNPAQHIAISAKELQEYVNSDQITADIKAFKEHAKIFAQQRGEISKTLPKIDEMLNYVQANHLNVDDILQLLEKQKNNRKLLQMLTDEQRKEYFDVLNDLQEKITVFQGFQVMHLTREHRTELLNHISSKFANLNQICNQISGVENQFYMKDQINAPLTEMKSAIEKAGILCTPGLDINKVERELIDKAKTIGMEEAMKKAVDHVHSVRAGTANPQQLATPIAELYKRKAVVKAQERTMAGQAELYGLAASRLQHIQTHKQDIVPHLQALQTAQIKKPRRPSFQTLASTLATSAQRFKDSIPTRVR